MSESKETARLLQWLNSLSGVFAFKIHADMYQLTGVNDVLVCWQGRYLFIEMKAPNKAPEPTPKQAHFQRMVRERGRGKAFTANSLAMARQTLIRMQWLDPIEHTGQLEDRPREPNRTPN